MYTIAASGTDDVVNVDQTSNVNIPGKWVFRVDGATIDDLGCFTDSKYILWYYRISCADPEGVRDRGFRTCLKNHIAIGFLSNTGPNPLKNHKVTKPAFNVGSSPTTFK